ncbi:T9SS type A sorting domain-containing protein [Flavobacterium selenitireducens]|uniref:T9SS type A sorting domain-containing protein n=1 Tax=Flavobacterium selenitireducens TaxID=2722704 RepID=UPI00168BAADA|nr:T9SS type A sorting domain-containing protein [Flavobacterium selenitireducens]MBD3582319.1 T9SS type A sorting domain-containing protein [Flavobacterium selenitireducens]
MKLKLLLLFIGLMVSTASFAQATAYPVPDLSQCGNQIFDLTVTETVTLGNQFSANFIVTWHNSLTDAVNATNPISEPNGYFGMNGEFVFLRVTNVTDETYDTTSFELIILNTILPNFPDVTACNSYTLPGLEIGNYYTAAYGQGTLLPPGTTLTTSMEVYVYFDGDQCSNETSFTVILNAIPPDLQLENVVSCANYVLPALPAGYVYNSGIAGTGTVIYAGQVITESMTIYVVGGSGFCSSESSFTVTIQTPDELDLEDVTSCTPYALPNLIDGQSYHFVPGGLEIEAGTMVYHTQTVFVTTENGNCGEMGSFSIAIGDVAYVAEMISVCGLTANGTFDFTSIYADVAAINPDAVATLYHNMADATTQSNQLLPTYTSTTATETVYLRIDNPETDCFSIQPLVLQILPCTDSSVSGLVNVDDDNDGCDSADGGLEGVQVACANGNHVVYAYTNAQGEFTFQDVWTGENVLYVVASTLPQGTVMANDTPQIVNITGNGQSLNAEFCVTDETNIKDAGILFFPQTGAVPGFVSTYVIQIRNHGGSAMSGSTTLTFDETRLDFVSSSTAPSSTGNGTLTIDFADVEAFGMTYIWVNFTVAIPPTANSGDVLPFTAVVAIAEDTNPANNTSTFNQTVVNSYDPNDITCHEGDSITPEQATQPLHYTIRFQNTGTAPAVNVRLENELSELLDWGTFRPIGASHNYLANRTGNQVTFSFPDIDLPAEQDDEAGSNGFVTYEIKPRTTVVLGDVIDNTAEIYFDFNQAIVTNTASTTIAQLSTPENDKGNFVLYPNPANGQFAIRSSNVERLFVEITDVRGVKVLSTALSMNQNDTFVDASGLMAGIYFVKIGSGKSSVVKKLVIK